MPRAPPYKSLIVQFHQLPKSPSMSSYLDYPRVFDIAAQLYADQLSEDQRFHLQNELDDEAVMNILSQYILAPQLISSSSFNLHRLARSIP